MTNQPKTPKPDPQTAVSRRSLIKSTAACTAAGASATFISQLALAQSSNAQESTMTAEEAANVVRRGYHGFNTADLALLSEVTDKNFTWETPGKTSIAGLRKGHAEVFPHWGRYGGESNGTFKAELKFVTADSEGNVVGVHHNVGTRNGKQLDVMCCIAFTVKDGKVMSGKEHFFDLYNWDAYWA